MVDDKVGRNLLRNTPVLTLSRVLFRLLFPLFGGLDVSGKDNIPHSGAVLICPNHTSDLDPVVICAGTDRPDLNALAKSELFVIPILGRYFHAIGATPVVRDSPDRAALRVAESILQAGRMLLVFPEGRCSKSGLLQDVQPGAMLLALRTGTPIIPAGIRGARNILPYGKYLPKYSGGGVKLVFGKAILPQSYGELPHRLALRQMTADVRASLAALTGQS